jgi:putative (di)nucleoside polyphosphate hydrolase
MKYRANVAGILRHHDGRILICERLGVAGAWQFPQGGIDPGESPQEALVRELWEEIGLRPHHFAILQRRGPYRYLYGNGRLKKGYHGKEQLYFLCDFLGEERELRVDTEHPEFQAFRWIAPAEFQLSWLPEMKREVYRAVFQDFFTIKI